MLIKAGVDISRLKRDVRRALGRVNRVFSNLDRELIVTSTFEGNHSAGSLHYSDDAFDVRYPDPPVDEIIHLIRIALGPDYDVVEEKSHIHIERDPK